MPPALRATNKLRVVTWRRVVAADDSAFTKLDQDAPTEPQELRYRQLVHIRDRHLTHGSVGVGVGVGVGVDRDARPEDGDRVVREHGLDLEMAAQGSHVASER